MEQKTLITLNHDELSEAATDYLLKIKAIEEGDVVISADAFDTMDFEICRSDNERSIES